jgi:hypothetical protein
MHRALSWALAQNVVRAIPEDLVDDPLMLARIGYAFVDGFAQVNAVVQNSVDVALVDRLTAPSSSLRIGRRRRALSSNRSG